MYERETARDTGSLAMVLFRLGMVAVFLIFIGRLFLLQIVQGEEFQSDAADNRYKLIEVAAKRGVMRTPRPVSVSTNVAAPLPQSSTRSVRRPTQQPVATEIPSTKQPSVSTIVNRRLSVWGRSRCSVCAANKPGRTPST